MTRKEYFEVCKNFDWFYQMSDDHRVFMRGDQRYAELRNEANEDPEKMKILQEWNRYVYRRFPAPEGAPGPRETPPNEAEFNIDEVDR